MVNVNIELTDWAEGRDLFIFADNEEVARKMPDQEHWFVKVGRCDNCGKCCMELGSGVGHPFPVIDGQCARLQRDGEGWRCGLAGYRPFACCIGGGAEDCPIRFEEYSG